MIENLLIVIDVVDELNGETFRRIENNLDIMRAILVIGTQPQFCLLLNGLGQLVSGGADEVTIKRVHAILSERTPQRLPGFEVILYDRVGGLFGQRPRALEMIRLDMHACLRNRYG